MVEFRSFRNSDPPAILSLWHETGLGRGAAIGITNEAFDLSNYSQPYFDRHGLIVATDQVNGYERVVGMVHAGFATTDDESQLDHSTGTISALLVDPQYRRQGIGQELLARGEAFTREHGATTLLAGPARSSDPFYYGLYGGARPSGFLESDPLAAPFFQSQGFAEHARHGIFQRDLSQGRDPSNFQVVSLRRKSELDIRDAPEEPTWWWYCHPGRFDSVVFRLVSRLKGELYASLTVTGLDIYLPRWQERAVGLTDVWVREDLRGKGYGQTLVIEVIRRLRQELVTRVEMHCPETNTSLRDVINACLFEQVDTGIVYQKTL